LNCPSCAAALHSFTEPCPSCGKRPPLTEGALAPDPLARLVPARLESLREIPGRKRKDAPWKDEVRQRVSRRRAQRLGMELPLFPEPEAEPELEVELDAPLPSAPAVTPAGEVDVLEGLGGASAVAAAEGPRLVWSMPEDDAAPPPPKMLALDPSPTPPPSPRWSLDDRDDDETEEIADVDDAETSGAWALDAAAPEPATPPAPLERPAQWTDRLQAAAFDLGLLVALWAVVVYFASRVAHVSIEGLWAAWPFLVGYLAFLGLVYAVYFTGTCGRTVGKIVCGLRVVDVYGQPPGYPKALLRALLGTAGMALGMVGMLPIFFDPARRSLHDRLVRTRVVKY
jgi:uncharacterized RDD family membrane protein YckC